MCLCKIQQMNERRAMKEDMKTKLYKCSTVNNPVNPRCGVIFNNNSTQPRFQLGIRKDFSFSLLWLQSMFKTGSKTVTVSKISSTFKFRSKVPAFLGVTSHCSTLCRLWWSSKTECPKLRSDWRMSLTVCNSLRCEFVKLMYPLRIDEKQNAFLRRQNVFT